MWHRRREWNGLMSGFKVSGLVFLDESGYIIRQYTYSLGGGRTADSTPPSKTKNTTILSSI